MIMAVLNQKGGGGKTTISLHVAYGLMLRGAQVLVVDADPQGSARDWASARTKEPRLPVIGIDRPIIHQDLPQMADAYDYVVIDGPPRVIDITRSAILAADSILIPVQPSPYDVWACEQLINLIKEGTVFKENLKSSFVINRKITNTVIARAVRDALTGYEIPVFNSMISQRVAFAESATSGQTVWETDPRGRAAEEMDCLVDEIMEVFA